MRAGALSRRLAHEARQFSVCDCSCSFVTPPDGSSSRTALPTLSATVGTTVLTGVPPGLVGDSLESGVVSSPLMPPGEGEGDSGVPPESSGEVGVPPPGAEWAGTGGGTRACEEGRRGISMCVGRTVVVPPAWELGPIVTLLGLWWSAWIRWCGRAERRPLEEDALKFRLDSRRSGPTSPRTAATTRQSRLACGNASCALNEPVQRRKR